MMNDPLVLLVVAGVTSYLAYLWWQDLQKARQTGKEAPGALPGARPCPWLAVAVAVAGALILLAAETAGEYALGLHTSQTTLPYLAIIPLLAAGFYEEIIFRGYLIVTRRGRLMLWGSAILFSLLFAVIHDHIWSFTLPEDTAWYAFWQGEWTWHFTTKAWFSTAFLFFNSLWFYTVRFFALNPLHSLIPCIAAHVASNLGVYLIKGAQGFLE